MSAVNVLKFGGTSVGSASNMKRVADIVIANHANIVVLSAMSGTTDMLVKLSVLKAQQQPMESVINRLKEKYTTCLNELFERSSKQYNEAEVSYQFYFDTLEQLCCGDYDAHFDRNIVVIGELLTSRLFYLYLSTRREDTIWVDITAYMHCDSEGNVDKKRLKGIVATSMIQNTCIVTQGFIARDIESGALTNLGRGGSDLSATLLGAAIAADEVQIWTDIDGVHNNDPRYVDNTYPLSAMSFRDAAELAYFGAKILHPTSMLPCWNANINVRLKDTLHPEAPGTLVSGNYRDNRKYHAVAAKDGITVVRICSTRMLMAYGFLRRVFEVFERYRTPIDMITTSEVAVSLTIDDTTNLNAIVEDLKGIGKIELFTNQSIVCVVGNLGYDKPEMCAEILSAVGATPVQMVSYGASPRSMAFLVDTPHKIEVLRSLNTHLFNN